MTSRAQEGESERDEWRELAPLWSDVSLTASEERGAEKRKRRRKRKIERKCSRQHRVSCPSFIKTVVA